ncbi:hypothetical protein SAMN05421785_1213 [Chryseobacterium gambrini]|uniref:Uncharacterized protein n=3 Tax=Chryseobacterium TaxID=59732 RepID=A0A1N7QXU9_9FLAO|nr:hypothetical protein SAMN05421785_1213 [Chryseobacterium gambrini]
MATLSSKHKNMDLKTLNRIDKLRRLKSRGPQTPKWLKPYHLLIVAFLAVFTFGAFIKILELNQQ